MHNHNRGNKPEDVRDQARGKVRFRKAPRRFRGGFALEPTEMVGIIKAETQGNVDS